MRSFEKDLCDVVFNVVFVFQKKKKRKFLLHCDAVHIKLSLSIVTYLLEENTLTVHFIRNTCAHSCSMGRLGKNKNSLVFFPQLSAVLFMGGCLF